MLVLLCCAGILACSFAKRHEDPGQTIVSADTTIIGGEKYVGMYKTDDIFYVTRSSDTIFKAPDLHPNFEFKDFNGDGFDDIRIYYLTNMPDIQDLFLFDVQKRNFEQVTGFSDFPKPLPIPGTMYYYSYHRSGCSDLNWDSDLFYIENFRAVRIGNISAYGCNNRDVKDGIYIYKVKDEVKTLYQRLPVSTIMMDSKDDKWIFIRDYWVKKLSNFKV
jgi:hypothetical protein